MLENDSKVLLNTDGSGNLLKVINSIYGLSVTKKMAKVENSNDDYEIKGYISYPEVNRSSRNSITILVNNRCIKNYDVNKAIIDSYHTYLPKDRYPIVVLNIDCDPFLIDVNVHPTKMDIKFSKKEELITLISNTVSSCLEKLLLIPEVKYEDRPISNVNEVSTVNKNLDFIDLEQKEIKPQFETLNFDFNGF